MDLCSGSTYSAPLHLYKVPHSTFACILGIITPAANHAPFVCAGAPTTYAGLKDNINPSDIALILGIGGLGHLAVQFAAKMGVQVAVLSVIATEEAEARSFGASEGYFLSEAEKVTKLV